MNWPLVTLESLASDEARAITDGPFGSNLARQHYTLSGPRVIRLQNIGDGEFIDNPAHISQAHFERLRAHEVLPGDLLIASLGEVLPRGCLVPSNLGPAIVKADCIRVRLAGTVDPKWVLYSLQRPAVRRWADEQRHGVGRPRLGLGVIRRIPVPVPSLEEQRRIVAILEEHLSDLDAARRSLESAVARLERLATVSLWRSTHGVEGSRRVTLDEIAEVRLGRQRSPKNHSGPRMRPYLRAANVDWDRLRLDDVSEMNFTEAEERTYRLLPGDILLAEASGSAAEVGKSVIYEGKPSNVCFQNTLLRVRCHDAQPEFVQKYLLAEARAGRFMPESRGVGINHLGRARLAGLVVDLPNEAVQREAAQRVEELLDQLSRAEQVVRSELSRTASLRRAVLAAAFSGRLTGHGSQIDIIEQAAADTKGGELSAL